MIASANSSGWSVGDTVGLAIVFGILLVLAAFRVRSYWRLIKMTDDYPGQPPPQAPPSGSEDAAWERQQREAWAREHPDWADWERSYDKVQPEDAPSGSDDSDSQP